jgi:DNA-directed RNA polymerase subunit beta'
VVDNPLELQWKAIRDRVDDALRQNFPLEGRKNRLVLHDLHFDERNSDPSDIHAQEKAKMTGATWGVPVYGDISLVDKVTGKEVDRQKVKLLTVPKPTPRYSYIVDGNERQVDSLWKLRSGVYAHQKQNGLYEAEFNLAHPFARNPKLYIPFNPEKKQFKLKYESSHIPLYSVLKTLGVADEDMKKHWGEEIYKANAVPEKKVNADVLAFYDRISKRGVKADSDSLQDKATAIFKAFEETKLLPDTTKAVLGKPLDHVNGEALLLASGRILSVARGDIPQDDRDSLIFKKLHGIDDFLHENLTKYQTKKSIQQKVGNNIDRQAKVRDVISGDLFSRPMHEFFTKSSRNADQVNPLEMISGSRATTILMPHEGGIKDEQKVTGAMKLINASHFGFLDPIHTPESEKTGLTLHLPLGVHKEGNEAQMRVYDLKEEKVTSVGPAELHTNHIVLPDQVEWKNSKPYPIASTVKMKDPTSHDIVEKPFKEGRYLVLSAHQLFDEATNLIPFLQNNQGNRTMTASRQATQAVSLHHREAPLVQVKSSGPLTFEKVIGTPWSHESPVSGKVSAIKKNPENGHPDSLVVQGADGTKHEIQLYNHFPLNDAKSFLHSTPTVEVGDSVKKGQVIADSNYTRNGTLALGTNLRVSYLPYKGYNFEDGIVISESASKRLTSEHVHRQSIEVDPLRDFVDKKKFITFASTTAKKLTSEQADKIGDDGVIRVGSKVMPGDVLIASVGKSDLSGEAARAVGRLDKKMYAYQDKSKIWEKSHPGEVVKVLKNQNNKEITVFVKTLEPMEIGDKMVGRHGNKGIVTRILPDSEMPRIGKADHDGSNHVEVLMNPSGVPTRINLGQMLETAAAKIAMKTGKPYQTQNFVGGGVDYTEKLQKELADHGLSDQETIYDPSGKKVGSALTGYQYIMKLQHQVEKKLAVRGGGSPRNAYSIDHAPKGTGASHPGQGIGQLEFYSLLAHGARANLREMATYKSDWHMGERNDPNGPIDFWHRVMTGQPLPAPQAPFAYKKFETLLTGLGVNVKKEGNQLVLQPLTDKGVLALSNGEIKDPGRVLRGKDAKELEKGIFDPKITGGLPNDTGKGLKWSHITLAEPLPNPIFVGTKQHPGPAVVLSGLKFDEFEEIVRGKKYVDGKTGGPVIQGILKKIDVKTELKKVKEQIPTLRGTILDKANRKMKFLTALEGLGMKPHEAYIMNHVPVIPPIFRPIIPMQDGTLRFDDINHYYKSLGNVTTQLKSVPKELPDDQHQDLREQAYDLTKALAGIPGGTPVYESGRPLKGILDTIAGEHPKLGYFQNRLMKRRQDLSMRSTIIPEPAMHLDHVGLPKDAAMELYKPFVVREMASLGYDPVAALKEIKKGTDISWRALQVAMDKRPVMLKRDPALHKFSIMAFKPTLVEGKAIKIHPLVTAGYNADFDGDTMSAFVPLTQEAIEECHKMFPSNNLFSSTNGGIMYAPDHEALLGLNLLSQWGKSSGKSFSTFQEALKAKDKGTLHVTDVIKVGGKSTTLGRLLIAEHLPDEIKQSYLPRLFDPKFELVKYTKGSHQIGVHDLLGEIARHDPKSFSESVDNLKNLGNKYSYEMGASLGLDDLKVHKTLRDGILKKYDEAAGKVKRSSLTQAEKNAKTVDIYTNATAELVKAHEPVFEKENNNMYRMVASGARGKMAQFRQMTIGPMLMKDGSGNTLPNPVKKSYSEGLDIGDYWTTLHGARMGTLQRVEGTSEPGRLTKEIVNVVIPNMIVSKDCGTTQGISMGVNDDDIHDRFLASPVKLPGGKSFVAGTLIDSSVTTTLKKHKIDQVVVRSPLKCAHGQGMCAKCFGLNENGNLHENGVNIGVIAGHAMGEPATQLAMDSFHTGGVAASRGGGSVDKFTRLNQLLSIPKTLKDSAVLSRTSGKVHLVEKDKATNGWWVHVGEEKHFIPAQRLPQHEGQPLRVGTSVKRGDALSNGNINPRELLQHTDIHTVQNYLTDELYRNIYKSEGVKRRNIETVVRSLTNLTRVKDPGDSGHVHGDVTLRTVLEEHNRNLKPGERPIEHVPLITGAQQTALDQHEDWMARLNFQELRHTILEGTAKGWKTDLHGTNPIPAYAVGSEFGLGTKEKPHNY